MIALPGASTLKFGLGGPIQGKSIQKGWISCGGSDFNELTFEVFVWRLDEGKYDSSRGTILEHPQFATCVFGFEEVEEKPQRTTRCRTEHTR